MGIKRGLYSNEAGVGSAPNAAAAATTTHPVKQGLVQMLSVYIDTVILCNATAFMCLVSGVPGNADNAGALWVQTSLHKVLGDFGPLFITVSMLVFSLLYTPCVAAVASIRRELGNRWAIGVVVWQCALAWVFALITKIIVSGLIG